MTEQSHHQPQGGPAATALKLAPNHEKVYGALQAADRPMTAYELIDAVRDSGISAPPTVYRALNKLIEMGLAHRLESLNAFVACAHGNKHRSSAIFLICNTCGETREVVDQPLELHLQETSEACGFHMEQATVELRGHCGRCDGQESAGESRP